MDRKEQFFQKTWVVALFCVIACLLWGSAFSCVKIGYGLFEIESGETASQILFAGIRFAIAGLLTITWGSIGAKKPLIPRKTDLKAILLLCLAQTIGQYTFYYIGLAHTTGVKAAILSGTKTLFVVFIAAFLFRNERFTWQKLLGCILGFCGVALVNLTGDLDFSFSMFGEGFLILSAVFSALAVSLMRNFGQNSNPVLLSGWQFFLGGCVLALVGLLAGGRIEWSGAGTLLLCYLALISSVAFGLTSILLKFNRATRVQAFLTMIPVFGVLLSAVILQEYDALGIQTVFALLLVIAGIFVIQQFGEGKNKKNRT